MKGINASDYKPHESPERAVRFGHMRQWINLFTLTALSIYAYVFMEWLFFVTKPSFMSTMAFGTKLGILLLTPLLPFIAAIACLATLATLALINQAPFQNDFLLIVARLIPATILASLLLLLIDNFTYTVLNFGIISSEGIWRGAYALLFLVLLAFNYRYVHRSGKTAVQGRFLTTQVVLAISLSFTTIVLGIVEFPRMEEVVLDRSGGSASADRFPNIILIGSDGLNAERLSAYGYDLDTTPFLREFAKTALLAENNFPNASSSGGSVSSIMTGKLPTETGLIYPPDILKGVDAYQHLPGILKRYGYRNIELGVPHYADAYDLNIQNGFDMVNFRSHKQDRLVQIAEDLVDVDTIYFLSRLRERILDRLLHVFYIRSMTNPYEEVTEPKPVSVISDRRRINELLSLFDETDAPLFVHVHMMGTHGPIFFPRRNVFSAGKIQDRWWMTEFYDDAILDFDRYVEKVVEYLSDNGILDETIVIVYTDHAILYKTDVRVPLIIRFPNEQHAGRIRSNVQNLDIAPTILDYLGLTQPAWMSGHSLLEGEPDQQRHIFSASWNPNNLTKRADGVWVVDMDQVGPPFYQLGKLRLVLCQMWFELDLINEVINYGEVEGHTNPCDESEIPTLDNVEKYLVNHLTENGYDVAGLSHPLLRVELKSRAEPLLQQESVWTITTNIPASQREEAITRILRLEMVQLRFPIDDPEQGDYIAAAQTIPVEPEQTYEITLEVWDPYKTDGSPGVFEQRVYIGDTLVWSHDISQDGFSGWQLVRIEHEAQAEELTVRAEVIATGSPEKGLGWGGSAAIAVRNLEYLVLEDHGG